jgi:hypothetical protein
VRDRGIPAVADGTTKPFSGFFSAKRLPPSSAASSRAEYESRNTAALRRSLHDPSYTHRAAALVSLGSR